MTIPNFITSSGDIGLVPLAEEHLPITLEWRNRDDVRMWFKSSDLVSYDTHHKWFMGNQKNPNDLVFLAVRVCDERPAAQLSLYNIDRELQQAEFGRLIVSPEFRGTGTVQKAIELLLCYAKQCLLIKFVHLEVLNNNLRAKELYRKLGFATEVEGERLTRMTKAL